MKKIVSVCLLLVLAVSFSVAEGKKPVEILFRGNEWGASYAEVLRSFPSDTKWRTPIPGNSCAVLSYIYNEYHEPYYRENVACWTNSHYSILDKELMVAGYPLDRAVLRFAYRPEGNGLIASSNPRTAFICGEYHFIPVRPDPVFDALSEKLVALYGDGYEEIEPKDNTDDRRLRVWEGLNGTYVSLAVANNDEVQIRYTFSGGDQLLAEAQNARALEEQSANPLDFDGL